VISYRATSSSFSVISKAINRCREVYERAVENIPPIQEKRYWRRYIYLWLSYAIFEELHGGEIPLSYLQVEQEGEEQGEGAGNKSKVVNGIKRAREVYQECLKVIPHKVFTFGKIWLEAAYLEVRDKDLTAARKLLGRAIGKVPPLYRSSSCSCTPSPAQSCPILSRRSVSQGEVVQRLHRVRAAAWRDREMSSDLCEVSRVHAIQLHRLESLLTTRDQCRRDTKS
jgi:hypothetical protein